MSVLAPPLPSRRSELRITPIGERGRYVVKDQRSGDFFQIGPEEHFLLLQLDGEKNAEAVCAAFTAQFNQPLKVEELDEFIGMARKQGFLQAEPSAAKEQDAPAAKRQSILYWRKRIFDPDRFITWLEPKIRFFWTRGFLIFSAACIILAACLMWSNQAALVHSFYKAFRWETAFLAWLTLLTVTMLHEFAHGLTCKHHGGEVREIGFLLMFFMPCFYCNVSDAWLFKEKSKRLWVTMAGGYFEMFLWALAVFVWRLTMQDSLVNYLAFVVLSVSAVRTFFNANPLIKLDGYYLLSDWLETPNLQQRGHSRFKANLRWLLWGAARPQPEPGSRRLWLYGLASWLYMLVFLSLMLWFLSRFAASRWGWLGLGGVGLLGFVSMRGLFRGLSAGEINIMFWRRPRRTFIWMLVLGGLGAALCLPTEDWAPGTFHLRARSRVEVRAPVSGLLHTVYFDEGEQVSAGALLVRLEVPDLDTKLARKQAEVAESGARLKLLEIGARPEEIQEQAQRVERAKAWRDLGSADLTRLRKTLDEEMEGIEKKITSYRAELDAANDAYRRAVDLKRVKVIEEEVFVQKERRARIAQAQLEEVEASKRARLAKGALEPESELAKREKDLADAQALLTLLKAGSRPEEIDAERARLRRLKEEVRYLEEVKGKLAIPVPVAGIITTPRLKEKAGQFFKEGDLICVVEDPASLEVEIEVAEQDLTHVRSGQEVSLKPRLMPEAAFSAKVERLAANALRADHERGEAQSKIVVYCSLAPEGNLRPDMSGYARIYTGQRPLGAILLGRVVRLVRTEFWW